MPKKIHSTEKVQEFWRLRAERKTYQQISDLIGVPYWTLIDWAQRKTRVKDENPRTTK